MIYSHSCASGPVYICPECHAETVYSSYCDHCGYEDIVFHETDGPAKNSNPAVLNGTDDVNIHVDDENGVDKFRNNQNN